MVKLDNDDFKMVHIGRGKWNDWHSVGFALTARDQAIHEYEHVLISCSQIRCQECHDHARVYLINTQDHVWSFLIDINLTDSEVIDKYNKWLYDFHCAANLNSGKDPKTFPTYDDVANYYLNFEICTTGCTGHS